MPNNIKRDFAAKYLEIGPDKFYRFLLSSAISKLALQVALKDKTAFSPEIELLDFYEKFLVFYRREGDEIYLKIASQCRKAAHKIYRELRKTKKIEKNYKFLNSVGGK